MERSPLGPTRSGSWLLHASPSEAFLILYHLAVEGVSVSSVAVYHVVPSSESCTASFAANRARICAAEYEPSETGTGVPVPASARRLRIEMSNCRRNAGVVSAISNPASSHPNVADSLVPSAAMSSSVFVSVSGMRTAFHSTVIPSATRSCGFVVVSQSSATAKSHEA